VINDEQFLGIPANDQSCQTNSCWTNVASPATTQPATRAKKHSIIQNAVGRIINGSHRRQAQIINWKVEVRHTCGK